MSKLLFTKREIAELVGISSKTLHRWLAEMGLDVPRGLIHKDEVSNILHRVKMHIQSKKRKKE